MRRRPGGEARSESQVANKYQRQRVWNFKTNKKSIRRLITNENSSAVLTEWKIENVKWKPLCSHTVLFRYPKEKLLSQMAEFDFLITQEPIADAFAFEILW